MGTAIGARKREQNQYLYKQDKFLAPMGSRLYQCPFTGFLGFIPPCRFDDKSAEERIEIYKNGGTNPFVGFSPQMKVDFIAALPAVWPNLTKALKEIDGPDRNTLHAHMESDAVFREAIRNIEREKIDELKATIHKFGKRPKNFMDRMALGRLYDPEHFDPARRLIVEQRRSVDQGGIQSRLRSLGNCVDAQLVENPQIEQPNASIQQNTPPTPSK